MVANLPSDPSLSCKHAHVPRCRIACWHLEEYETALEAFQAAKVLETNVQVSSWIAKCNAQLAGDPLNLISISSYPTLDHRS